jgi:hypothetical protein
MSLGDVTLESKSPTVQLYGTLFQNLLDEIPIRKPNDIETVVKALESLSSPQQANSFPAEIQETIEAIKRVMKDTPSLPNEAEEFRLLARVRLEAKINQLKRLDCTDKISYIAHQQKHFQAKAQQDERIRHWNCDAAKEPVLRNQNQEQEVTHMHWPA